MAQRRARSPDSCSFVGRGDPVPEAWLYSGLDRRVDHYQRVSPCCGACERPLTDPQAFRATHCSSSAPCTSSRTTTTGEDCTTFAGECWTRRRTCSSARRLISSSHCWSLKSLGETIDLVTRDIALTGSDPSWYSSLALLLLQSRSRRSSTPTTKPTRSSRQMRRPQSALLSSPRRNRRSRDLVQPSFATSRPRPLPPSLAL
jgi:hypothetical protein